MNIHKNAYVEYNKIKDFINPKNKLGSIIGDLDEKDKIKFLINWVETATLGNHVFIENLKDSSSIDEEIQKNINLDNLSDVIENIHPRWLEPLLIQSYNDWINLKNVQICIEVNRNKDNNDIDKTKPITDFILSEMKKGMENGIAGWHKWCEKFYIMPQSLASGSNYKGINAINLILKQDQGRTIEKLDENNKPVYKKDKDGNLIPLIVNGIKLVGRDKKQIFEKDLIFEPYTDNRWITFKNSSDYGGLKKEAKGTLVVNPLFQDMLTLNINEKVKLQCKLPIFKDLVNENKNKKTEKTLIEFQIEIIEAFISKNLPHKINDFLKSVYAFKNISNKNIGNFSKLLEKNLDINIKIYPNRIGDVSHTVFNVSDLNNPPRNIELEKIKTHSFDVNELNPKAEMLIKSFSDKNKIFHNNINGACFCVGDSIYLPPKNQFFNLNGYYSTVFHEMIHSTGQSLNRKMNNKFGTELYAREELVAEFGALLLGAQLGVKYDNKNHTSYILGWGNKAFGSKDDFKKEDPEDLIDIWKDMALNSKDFKEILNDAVKASEHIIKMMEKPEREKVKKIEDMEQER